MRKIPGHIACVRRPRVALETNRARRCVHCRRDRASGTAAPAVPRPGPAARAGSAPAAASQSRAPPATRSHAHRRRSPAYSPTYLPIWLRATLRYALRENQIRDKTKGSTSQ